MAMSEVVKAVRVKLSIADAAGFMAEFMASGVADGLEQEARQHLEAAACDLQESAAAIRDGYKAQQQEALHCIAKYRSSSQKKHHKGKRKRDQIGAEPAAAAAAAAATHQNEEEHQDKKRKKKKKKKQQQQQD